MNKEIIEGINKVIEGLSVLRDSLGESGVESKSSTMAAPKKSEVSGKSLPNPKEKDSAAEKNGSTTYTVSELEGMKYNEFKKLASSLGVDCKGTRAEIMERVVSTGVVSDADGGSSKEDEGENKVSKDNKPASVGKGNVKKAPSKDKFDEQAEAIIKETPAEDIIEALSEVGVKATKINYKKQLVKALRDGVLEIDDEDSEEEAADSDEAESEDILTAEDWYKEYDLSGVNDPNKMSDSRKEGCINQQNSIIDDVESGELSADDIVEYLQTVASQEELDLLGDEYSDTDLVKLYIEVSKHFIDDEGEEQEPEEPYTVNEIPFCCGKELAYDKKTKRFLCSQCAGEYEAE